MTPELSSAQLSITHENPICWLVVGQLLDARNRRILKNAHLVYDQRQILHLDSEPADSHIRNGKSAPDLTLPQYTALPGLIEGHAHIFLEGAELTAKKRADYQKRDPEALYRDAEPRLRTLAQIGITAVRDGGDKDQVGLRLSRLTAREDCPSLSAQVFSPGAGIYRQGRYGSFLGKPLEEHSTIETCVQARVAEGADHIKIIPTGIINFPKGQVIAQPQFSEEEIRQFRQATHAHDKQLMAHASGEAGVGCAIEGGVDTVEHGFFITDEQLAVMRDKNISWVPTFAPVQEQLDHAEVMGWTGETQDNLKRILENHAHSLQKALALGVNVLVGSDAGSCGVVHGAGLFYEMELMEQAGMSTLDVLCQATYGNRKILPGQQLYGSLERGFKPRFILTQNNPLETVKNLRRARWVIFDGLAGSSAQITIENL